MFYISTNLISAMKIFIMTSIFGIFIFLSCDSDNVTGDDSNLDCAGVANGNSVEDNCGVCDEDPTNDCVQDCAGVWGGNNICGCTDSTAINYNPSATFDDGSCDTSLVMTSFVLDLLPENYCASTMISNKLQMEDI